VIAYDADEAGQKATAKAIGLLGETSLKVRVLRVYGGKDPDEFIKTYGSERFRILLDSSGNPIEYKLANVRAKYNIELPEDKLSFLNDAVGILSEQQTKAFDHFVYQIMPLFQKLNVLDGLTGNRTTFNAPVIQNDINITNNTPFDVNNNFDNLNRVLKAEMHNMGIGLSMI
jgi:DNA primase